MPFVGDFKRLDKLRREMDDLAKPNGRAQKDLARSVIREVRGVLREQFAKGEGPTGPWSLTARGKPALVSKKLPLDFTGRPVPFGVQFDSRIPWLRAHHEGHVFATRNVAANAQFLTFDKKGRLIRNKRALNKRGQVKRGVFQTFARAHTVGVRTLVQRPIYPDQGDMPTKWAGRINLGASQAMTRWHSRATG